MWTTFAGFLAARPRGLRGGGEHAAGPAHLEQRHRGVAAQGRPRLPPRAGSPQARAQVLKNQEAAAEGPRGHSGNKEHVLVQFGLGESTCHPPPSVYSAHHL